MSTGALWRKGPGLRPCPPPNPEREQGGTGERGNPPTQGNSLTKLRAVWASNRIIQPKVSSERSHLRRPGRRDREHSAIRRQPLGGTCFSLCRVACRDVHRQYCWMSFSRVSCRSGRFPRFDSDRSSPPADGRSSGRLYDVFDVWLRNAGPGSRVRQMAPSVVCRSQCYSGRAVGVVGTSARSLDLATAERFGSKTF